MKMYSIYDIANYVLSKESMTHKKLQKVSFYIYSWALIHFREKVINTSFQAWVHGPVSPELYLEYKGYGYKKINDYSIVSIDGDLKMISDKVISFYSEFTGNDMEIKTHLEDPWKISRGDSLKYQPSNNKIEETAIIDYYFNLSDEKEYILGDL